MMSLKLSQLVIPGMMVDRIDFSEGCAPKCKPKKVNQKVEPGCDPKLDHLVL